MKKAFKRLRIGLLAFVILAMSVVPAMASNAIKKVDYVAFGDSLAAGYYITFNGDGTFVRHDRSEYAYTDDIADALQEAGILSSFTKTDEFCLSGMTAAQLAVNTDILNTVDTGEWHLVKDAELVTLDIGANDLLPALYGILQNTNDPASLPGALNGCVSTVGPQVQANIEDILQNILNANKNVKIYVMGYYNPFQSMLAGQDALLALLNGALGQYNSYIQDAVADVASANKGASICYVETGPVVSAAHLTPVDIHPTVLGYQVIADQFLLCIGQDFRALQDESKY